MDDAKGEKPDGDRSIIASTLPDSEIISSTSSSSSFPKHFSIGEIACEDGAPSDDDDDDDDDDVLLPRCPPWLTSHVGVSDR